MRERNEREQRMYDDGYRGHYVVVKEGYMRDGTYVPPVRVWVRSCRLAVG